MREPRRNFERNPEQTDRETAAFSLFCAAHASFCDSIARFYPAREFSSDVTALLKTGMEIDFELGEWLHEGQTRLAVKRDRYRRAISKILRPCLSYSPRNFRFVLLATKETGSANATQFNDLAKQFLALVTDVDQRRCSEPFWASRQYLCTDFSKYPALNRHLESAHFWPPGAFTRIRDACYRTARDPEILAGSEKCQAEAGALTRYAQRSEDEFPADSWIRFSPDGGAYSCESAIAVLRAGIEKKLKHYAVPQDREARLIVYYDLAVLQNTPYRDCLKYRNFDDIAREAARFVSQFLADGKSPFSKIYLLKALWPKPEVFEIWPVFIPCG
ncbi:MAG: hypothetical protein ACREF8_00305 [Chthoniobacterales bacterium]